MSVPDSASFSNGIVVTPPNLLMREAVEVRRIFRTDTTVSRRGWRVVGAGCERLPGGSYVQRRDFPYHTLEFISVGRGLVELAGKRCTLAGGCVYTVGADERFSVRTDAKRALQRYYLWMEGPEVAVVLNQAGLLSGRLRNLNVPGEVREAWEWLLRDGGRAGRSGAELAQGLAEVILLKLATANEESSFRSDSEGRACFERCRALADEQIEHLRGAAELAAAAGLRTETVCRQFQRYLGTTPGRYLRAKRIRLAAERLNAPGVSIKEVAAGLGFSDAFHFSRVFKQELGVSPKLWRSGNSE
ncbi:MAG: AraC family transcriptional regulator [Verrucomicrobia bacterium]|nr:AraC family transcriptional regulator [Verrucomicrobiota bacterium]